MSMNKVIHAAVRRDLARFSDALAGFRNGDTARAEQLWRAWENFDFQLTKHHHGEHETAWPALEAVGVSREVLDRMDEEHEAMAQRLAEARDALAALRRVPSADNAALAQRAISELQAVTVAHLDDEEGEIEELYLSRRDDPAIKAMGRAFARVGPREGGVFFAWVADGADAETAQALRANVPGPVLTVMGGLFGRSYRRDVAPVWRS